MRLALIFLVACATPPPVVEPPRAIPTADASPSALPTGWTGLYMGADSTRAFEALETADGPWLFIGGRPQRGFANLHLEAPNAVHSTWRLLFEDGTPLDQIDDPFLGRIFSKLRGEHVFTLIGEKTADRMIVTDGLTARFEGEKTKCMMMVHDPTENASRKPNRHPSQPTDTGMRIFLMLDVAGDCGAAKPEIGGMGGGAYVFARADGEPLAIQLVGYMTSLVFAAKGRTPAELGPILERSRREIERQAE